MLQIFTPREAGRRDRENGSEPGNRSWQRRAEQRPKAGQRFTAMYRVEARRAPDAAVSGMGMLLSVWQPSRWLAWSCALVFLLHGARAGAEETRASGAFAAGKVELKPEHRQVAWPEYVIAPLLIAGAFGQGAFFKPDSAAEWRGPILFDRGTQSALRVQSAEARQIAHQTSNALLASTALQAMVIDPWIVAGWIHGRPDIAWQLTVINVEAFGLTEFSNRLAKELVRRERPYGETCDPSSGQCQTDARNRSFFSGHASASSTFAGLTCAHHQRLALYGSFAADLGACAGALGVSLGTGMLRIASDNHWASDVLLGHFVGFSTGYLLTSALYYAAPPQEDAPIKPRPMIAPIIGSGVLGLAVQSKF
jgi:membrane-associated phospholipid phosphatase